jgi:hypothetical protein
MRFLMAVASPTSNEVLFRKHDRWRTLHTLVYTATRSMLRSRLQSLINEAGRAAQTIGRRT